MFQKRKTINHAKQSAPDESKTASKGVIQKTAEATSDSIGNKIAYKKTNALQNSRQNFSQTIEGKTEIPKERFISPEERQRVID